MRPVTEPIYKRLGRHIRAVRIRHGLSQGDIATAMGVTNSYISLLESGRVRLQIHTVKPLARALKVGPDTILEPLLA